MSKITERIDLFRISINASFRAFEIAIGVSNGTIGNAVKKHTDVSLDTISKIIETYPQLSAEWLIAGRGQMFITDEPIIQTVAGNNNAASINGSATVGNSRSDFQEKIDLLERILAEKERIIQILMKQSVINM